VSTRDKESGILGDGYVELPERIEHPDTPVSDKAEERSSKTVIKEHPEDLRLGDLIEYCKRLKAGTAIGLLGTVLGLLSAAAVVAWKAKAWVDEARIADLERRVGACTPPIGSDTKPLLVAPATAAPGSLPTVPSASVSTTAAIPVTPAPSCHPPKFPPPVAEGHPYCIEIARGNTPEVSPDRVFDLARRAQKELGVYWAGNPPAKANRIIPVNGGAHELVRVARWYGVSRPVAESVCDFMECRNWSGVEAGVEKVCEILDKCK
jgi:hypothetical protein